MVVVVVDTVVMVVEYQKWMMRDWLILKLVVVEVEIMDYLLKVKKDYYYFEHPSSIMIMREWQNLLKM